MHRDTISGTFTRMNIGRLRWPIAWSGTIDTETRREEVAAIAELAKEVDEIFRTDFDALAVEVENGQVIATIHE